MGFRDDELLPTDALNVRKGLNQENFAHRLLEVLQDKYSLQSNSAESADFKSQPFGALVVHLNDNSDVQAAQTQAVATKDSAGNLQAVLTLDFNGDGVLDKSAPAFAVIKLWVDVNQDGVQAGNEASSLSAMHISSINFKTGEVTYDDGHTDAQTASDKFFRSVA